MQSFAGRFWAKVDQRSDDECWPWLACRAGGSDARSYGYFGVPAQRMKYAHRVAYCLHHGLDICALPSSIVIRHRCDNGLCCNPAHLIQGTQADNVQDMIDRGRIRRGEDIRNAILTAHDIPSIRARLSRGELHRQIAGDFGVCPSAISKIARGIAWAWLGATQAP